MQAKTILFKGVMSGNTDAIKIALERGADIDSPNEFGWTPLMCAAYAKDETIAKFLIERGASVNCVAENGDNPLLLAMKLGDTSVARLLISKGADTELLAGQRNEYYTRAKMIANALARKEPTAETKHIKSEGGLIVDL